MPDEWPSYLKLQSSGGLAGRADVLEVMLRECRLCPHECRVDRVAGKAGFCKAPAECIYSTACAHGGEEPVLSGYAGSGTIFLTYCNSRCIFCQNYDISQLAYGRPVSVEELTGLYLALQARGCHNVNFVTPAHYLPHIIRALVFAVEKGFRLPLVYNSNGYDSVEVLRLLDGVFDIYLPDMKYGDEEVARRLSSLPDYPEINRAAVAEMFRQVGLLETDARGIARRGLIVRHLVLPHDLSSTEVVLSTIAGIDTRIAVSLMGQYHPAYRASQVAELRRRLSWREYATAAAAMERLGLKNGWTQKIHLLDDTFKPDFKAKKWKLD
jgi:putative pyruvate formate lyase activating enzyme